MVGHFHPNFRSTSSDFIQLKSQYFHWSTIDFSLCIVNILIDIDRCHSTKSNIFIHERPSSHLVFSMFWSRSSEVILMKSKYFHGSTIELSVWISSFPLFDRDRANPSSSYQNIFMNEGGPLTRDFQVSFIFSIEMDRLHSTKIKYFHRSTRSSNYVFSILWSRSSDGIQLKSIIFMNQRVDSQYGFSRFTMYRPSNEIVHFQFLNSQRGNQSFWLAMDHELTSKVHHRRSMSLSTLTLRFH